MYKEYILFEIKDEKFICLKYHYERLLNEYPHLKMYIKKLDTYFYDETEYLDLKDDVFDLMEGIN